MPQSEDLDETLNCEDAHKYQVETVKDGTHGWRLLRRLSHHADHVEQNEGNDDDVKDLVRDQVKHEALAFVLRRKEKKKKNHRSFCVVRVNSHK